MKLIIFAVISIVGISGMLLLSGCENKKSERVAVAKRASPALDFLQAKNHHYVTKVAAIPPVALAALEGKVQLCDITSKAPINLTDVHIYQQECTQKLNFALVSDTCCIISYRQGGIGVHDVVYYVRYKGKKFAEKYMAFSAEDTMQLASFLQELTTKDDPATMLAPPPPWPRDSTK